MTPEQIAQVIVYIGMLIGAIASGWYTSQRNSRKQEARQLEREKALKAEAEETGQQREATLESKLAQKFTDKLQETETRLTAEVARLESERQTLETTVRELREDLQTELDANSDLKRQLDQRDRELTDLRTKVEELQRTVNSMTRERATVDDELRLEREKSARLENELSAARGRITDLELKVIRLEARLDAKTEAEAGIVAPLSEVLRTEIGKLVAVLQPPNVTALPPVDAQSKGDAVA